MVTSSGETLKNIAQIRQVVDDWTRRIREEDKEGMVIHHTDEIVMFDVIPPLKIVGLAAYKKQWEPFFEESPGGDGSFDIDELEITAGDDVAFCHGLLRVGGQKEPSVRLTIGLRKIDGEWYITHEHHSAPGESE
jgi:ketosteroid isomerase-like protein